MIDAYTSLYLYLSDKHLIIIVSPWLACVDDVTSVECDADWLIVVDVAVQRTIKLQLNAEKTKTRSVR